VAGLGWASRFRRHACKLLAAGDDLEDLLGDLPEPPRASPGEQAVDPGWQDFQRWRAARYVER
jgi:hypothetical protein